jgi:integrator complex subunit 11
MCRKNALYSHEQIRASLARATTIELDSPLHLPGDITLTAHYAGHVLGACMFHCRIGATDLLYTGDYNMSADRHLGAAKVPRLRPDLMITESTFGTTVRDSRRAREREFLDAVHSTVLAGGKVLVPVNAVGSAQELSLLIDGFWERMGLTVRTPADNASSQNAAVSVQHSRVSLTSRRVSACKV